jgi:tetratricopeptide (TPR) repeat protein
VSSGGAAAARLGVALVLVAASLGSSCGAPGEPLFPSYVPPGPYDQLSDRAWAAVVEARAHWDAGDLRLARASLRRIASEFPRNIHVGVLVQELELELRGYGVALPDLGLFGDATRDEDAAVALRRHYRELAERAPTPERLVLAARLESDDPAARSLLERALGLDPDCAWAHYGAAFVALRQERFQGAKVELDRALELDPRHLPARRLRARMLASSAPADVAAEALDRWLDDARGNPFVRPLEIAEAEFDLALLSADTGDHERVETLCAGLLEGGLVDSASVYLILAATRIEQDEIASALEAARRASRAAPTDTLAHLQRALILQDWMAQPEKAYDAWVRTLEAANRTYETRTEAVERPKPSTIRDAQLWLFARTRLARLKAAGVHGELDEDEEVLAGDAEASP